MKKIIKDCKQTDSKKKSHFKITGIVFTVLAVVAISVVGLSACSNAVPDEETEDKEEVVDTVQPEADKNDKNKDKKEDKETQKPKPSQKPDKDKVDIKPEKTPAPTVKPSLKPQPSRKPVTPTEKPEHTQKPVVPTEKPESTPTVHTHTWEDVTEVRTTGYNEEQVLVEEVYDEQIEIGSHDVCNGCGASLSGMEEEDLMNHLAACGKGYHNETLYQTIHHDAVYETVKTPITETVVIGRRCTSCGTYEAY